MKKTMREIAIAFAVMGVICFVFWRIGWIVSAREAGMMLMITGAVIAVDLAASWIWGKVFHRRWFPVDRAIIHNRSLSVWVF